MADLKSIGRYEVKSEIAKGGMATVFHAYDPRFERDVAIKVLPHAFLHDPQFRTRFEREAKMIALLEHPAIVPVYDFGEEDGQPYIVMRYMSGGSLNERIQQGAIPVLETARMIVRLAPALDAAHARKIIHRDLKPGNILFDQYGNAYLSDFGIARLASASGTSATLTGETIIGTPTYMSPEQVQGEKTIDGRSDVYSLGVLVYQMLTGAAPYTADTPAKVMMMHVLQPPPNILQVRPDLPPGCEVLIEKAMAKDPNDRFSTASELATELENIVRGATGAPPLSSAAATTPPGAEAVPDYQMPTAATPLQTVLAAQKTRLGRKEAAAAAAPGAAVQPQPAVQPRRSSTPVLGIVIGVIALLVLGIGGLAAYMGGQGKGPLAMMMAPPSPTATIASAINATNTNTSVPPTFTATTVENTPTPPFTDTPEPATLAPTEPLPPTTEPPPVLPMIGGADKIAFLNANDIWAVNVDGTGLVQLTDDGTTKSNLQWSPDGQAVNYITGKCAYSVRLADQQKEILTCLNFVQYFKSFEISPDGKQVALSLDNQMYILPYDLNLLRSISVREDLTRISNCADFAPYLRNFVKLPRWSRDGSMMAMVIMGNAKGIGSADTVQVISMGECTPTPDIIDNFPPPRFTPTEYAAVPALPNFGWDGLNLFSLATFIRNGGFGKLYIYNSDLKKAQGPLNLTGECCYRDPIFTPDGTQLLFAFQKYPGEDPTIFLYLIPYGTIGTGVTYTPLPIPPIDPKSAPMPAFRPAR